MPIEVRGLRAAGLDDPGAEPADRAAAAGAGRRAVGPGHARPAAADPVAPAAADRARVGLGRGAGQRRDDGGAAGRSEEHTSELQSLMRISYAVFCLIKQNPYT